MLRALDRSSAERRCDTECLRRTPRPVSRQATGELRLPELAYPSSFAPATHFSSCGLGVPLRRTDSVLCHLRSRLTPGPAYLPNTLTLSCKPPHMPAPPRHGGCRD